MRINAALVSLQTQKPAYAYGQLAYTPLKSGAASALFYAGIPADVPDDAVVTLAEIVLTTQGPSVAGSRTISATLAAASWAVSKATWNNQPATTGTARTEVVGAVGPGYEIRIDVTDHVQGMLAGTITNRGWRITSSDTTPRNVYGATASGLKPYLEFTYVLVGEVPTNLSPDGGQAVSLEKPTLTFAVPEDTTHIQVQVDAAADEVSPDFDSGEVASTAGMLDLAGTAYAGLALVASTSWRARVRTASGLNDWSDWATFSRVAKPTVAITSPGSTSGDPTPPLTWTASAQAVWQAWYRNTLTGALIETSGPVASADLDWTPSKGLKRVADEGRYVLRVWDDEDRVATPGDPVYTEVVQDFTLVASGDAEGVQGFRASQGDASPAVRLDWSFPAADFWQITRDGEWLARIDGLLTTYTDYTAAPNHQHVYRVFPVSDGVVSPNGPTATITPSCTGVWLIDPDDGTAAVLLGQDAGEFRMDEQSVTHDIVGGAPVRRRAAILPPAGSFKGGLLDALDRTADDSAAVLYAFKVAAPSTVYRLVIGDWNIPVTIGDVVVQPTPLSSVTDRIYEARFAWSQTGDELPWNV